MDLSFLCMGLILFVFLGSCPCPLGVALFYKGRYLCGVGSFPAHSFSVHNLVAFHACSSKNGF